MYRLSVMERASCFFFLVNLFFVCPFAPRPKAPIFTLFKCTFVLDSLIGRSYAERLTARLQLAEARERLLCVTAKQPNRAKPGNSAETERNGGGS